MQAALTASLVTGADLVAVERSKHPAVPWPEDFVALEPGVDMPEAGAQAFRIDAFGDVAELVSAGQREAAEPTLPTAIATVLLECVEAG